ncbi:MAG: hypothetical protein ACRC2T_12025 [Thermoguttaceae bacterium]
MFDWIIDTILCTNGFIPTVAAYVGIAGFIITIITLVKVRNVQSIIKEMNRKHLIVVLLPEYLGNLK